MQYTDYIDEQQIQRDLPVKLSLQEVNNMDMSIGKEKNR